MTMIEKLLGRASRATVIAVAGCSCVHLAYACMLKHCEYNAEASLQTCPRLAKGPADKRTSSCQRLWKHKRWK